MGNPAISHEILPRVNEACFLLHTIDFHEIGCAAIEDLRTCVTFYRLDTRKIGVCCNYFIKPRSTQNLKPTPDVALERVADLCFCQLG